MEKKTDRRVRKTKAQLRAGLAKLMQTKSIKEITVKELVDEVDINRSTFYLHYTDIYQMLESIEDELEGEINQIVNNHPVDSYYKESFPMIKEILEVLWDNRDICNALPVFNRISIKPVKIFVVPIHVKRRKWFFFQPVEQMFFFFIFFFKTPYSAKVPTDNHIIIFGHFFLFRKILSIKSPVFTMTISCNVNHLKFSFLRFL